METTLSGLPPDAASVADSSVGGAVAVAGSLPASAADALRSAADAAFVGGMSDAALVAAGVVLIGSVTAAVWLPARAQVLPEPAEIGPPTSAEGLLAVSGASS